EMPRAVVADMLGRLAVALAAGIDLRRAWQLETTRDFLADAGNGASGALPRLAVNAIPGLAPGAFMRRGTAPHKSPKRKRRDGAGPPAPGPER
ncbi:MAG: hypothetical protein ACKOWG_01185, partial [Planctomycetia bacterium]